MFLAIIAILLTLLLVVGIHEAGHALVARIFQVKIKKISLGFGKPLLRWQSKSGCEWVCALLPLGGYVQLQNTRISPVEPEEYPYCFDKKPIWQRALILLAGALANLVTAWFALILVYTVGLDYRVPQIQAVQSNSIAARAGMLPGDQLIAIGGHATNSWNDVGMELVILWGGKDIPVTLAAQGSEGSLSSRDGRRDNTVKEVHLDLSQIKFHGIKISLLEQLGIKPNLSAVQEKLRFPSLLQAIDHAHAVIGNMLYFFLMVLKQLFSGLIPFSALLGPLGIFAASVASLTQGIVVFMFFIASLSLAVALVNLFPIPGLDGGSLVYALIEKIRGKPVSVALEILLHRLVFIVFCVVLVHLVMNDLQRI